MSTCSHWARFRLKRLISSQDQWTMTGMAREIDDKKKRKALRKLRKAAERAEAEGGPGLSDWEKEFVEEVETRVEKYGSAFADPDKGRLDEPLSALQTRKLKEIDKKSRGKSTGGFRAGPRAASSFKSNGKSKGKSKGKQGFTPRSRDINDDLDEAAPQPTPAPAPSPGKPMLVRTKKPAPDTPPQVTSAQPEAPARKAPAFRIIKGGKDT